MPAVDDPFSIAASLPGQLATLKAQVKDLSVNRTQSPSILTVGAGGITDLGALAVTGLTTLSSAVTLGGGVTGPVAATGALSGTTVAATGALTGASVVVTGAASSATSAVSGNSTVGGSMSATVGLASSGARANILTTWIAAQLDPSGNLGIVSSSATVKQDFTPADMSPEVAGILQASMVEFRYIDHVEKYGDEAPVMLGSIAEYFPTIGLGRYVSRNSDGEVDGIQYAELVKPLIATIQHLNARLKVLEANSLTG